MFIHSDIGGQRYILLIDCPEFAHKYGKSSVIS